MDLDQKDHIIEIKMIMIQNKKNGSTPVWYDPEQKIGSPLVWYDPEQKNGSPLVWYDPEQKI